MLAGPAVEVGAVDQLGPVGGYRPGGDQRGYRDALAALRGHLHHRGAAAAAQVRPLGGLRPWPDSSSKQSQTPGGPGPGRSSRSGAAAHPARPACSPPRTARDQRADPGQHPALVLPALAAGSASSTASSSRSCAGVSLHRAPPAPLEASACFPPAASASRHRFASISDTRNRRATSQSLVQASISSAAASRTRSRRPVLRGQPAAIGVPHSSGIARCTGVTRASPCS